MTTATKNLRMGVAAALALAGCEGQLAQIEGVWVIGEWEMEHFYEMSPEYHARGTYVVLTGAPDGNEVHICRTDNSGISARPPVGRVDILYSGGFREDGTIVDAFPIAGQLALGPYGSLSVRPVTESGRDLLEIDGTYGPTIMYAHVPEVSAGVEDAISGCRRLIESAAEASPR